MRTPRLLTSSVGIICPTYNPDDFMNKLLPSIKFINDIRNISTWLLNFNGPHWTPTLTYDALNEMKKTGFKFKWICTGIWDKPIKVLKMREQCAEMEPDCELYLFVDDDFRFVEKTDKYPFTSGRRYLHSIDYMTRHPKCGLVNVKSFLGGTPQKLKIIPVKADMVATNQGLLLRNMKRHGFRLALPDMRDIRGGLEEQSIAYLRNEFGYYTAKMMNCPTVHITGKLSDWDNKHDDFHNTGVIDKGLAGWIRNRYGADWEYQRRKAPDKVWEMYKKNGGVELDDSLIVDYATYEKHWDPNSINWPVKKNIIIGTFGKKL